MDISVNASYGEPFGLVLIEAMAFGVPVVAFDAGGPAEILDATSGLLVPIGDEGRLTDALERLISDPDLRRQVGAGGQERFRTHFTAARMADDLACALERLRRG
jgi:glycosyltransferase involved in cell wall biosynthesis